MNSEFCQVEIYATIYVCNHITHKPYGLHRKPWSTKETKMESGSYWFSGNLCNHVRFQKLENHESTIFDEKDLRV